MSVRHYNARGNRRSNGSANLQFATYALLAITILFEVAYPLTHGSLLKLITALTVYFAAATCFLHALLAFGKKFVTLFAVTTLIFSFLIELIGVKSGWPFGTYRYDSSLGLAFAGVPIIVPFAWIMIAYPTLIAARKSTRRWVFLYGGLLMAAWDLFLDPQMVDAGRWHWKLVGPHSPFAPEIPLSNDAGWLFAGMGLIAILNAVLPRDRRKGSLGTLVPNFMLAWVFISGLIGNLFFFHHPGLAVFGGAILLVLLLPYAFMLKFSRPDFD